MKKFNGMMLIGGLLLAQVAWAGSPIFSITPSTSSITTRSDAETSVIYSVTNNSTKTISGLSVDPAYLTTGVAVDLTLQNDTCTNAALASGGSCTFGLIVRGANQPSSFMITPKVCAANGVVCSYAGSSGKVVADVYAITNPVYAYFPVQTTGSRGKLSTQDPASYSLLPYNTATETFGTPVTGLHLLDDYNNAVVAVSLDGKNVYVAEEPNSNTGGVADIAVLTGGAGSQLLTRILLNDVTTTGVFSMAVTPDGKKLYVTVEELNASKVYAIDLSDDRVAEISSSFSYPIGVVISPDGSRAFVSNLAGGDDRNGSITVINTATNEVVATIDNSSLESDCFQLPSQVIVSPDGSRLYVPNIGVPMAIINIGPDDDYTFHNQTIPIYYPVSMALSNDGDTLYVASSILYSDSIEQVSTHTLQMRSITLPSSDNAGVSLTPDNTQLFVSPFTFVSHGKLSIPVSNPSVVSGLPTEPESSVVTLPGGYTAFAVYGNFVN